MPPSQASQIVRIGVDVGGTFTDLVAWDESGGGLSVVKIPSTPPKFHQAVIEAVSRVPGGAVAPGSIIHGSTVATNALLQRAGPPVAFITTEGFRDMLLIGRQERPRLYALRVERHRPISSEENWFTVRERIDARGRVVEPLTAAEIDRVIDALRARGLRHAAVCLLFSFLNPVHEHALGARLEAAGIAASLSCDVLPEFREYERASTTAITAFLRPTVEDYLQHLDEGLAAPELRIMHGGGGTLGVESAARNAARLVLSGPAGGVLGAAFVARTAGIPDIISYDMGGTSTDVATVSGGAPLWTARTVVDGLPLALPMFDINTIGAGGGSIAYVDAGGALRVGPQSAGAVPGPACYGRGGDVPTVTDANVVLGRILPDCFLGGAMTLDADAAHRVIERLGRTIGKDVVQTALGVVRIVEANMAHAVRAVTSRRGRDPRQFKLVSFGGAGGLHACGLAEALDIPRVLVPPLCGVLSALGMIVAPPAVDVSRTVLGAGALNNELLATAFADLSRRAACELNDALTKTIQRFAQVRFLGQSHEVAVSIDDPTLANIHGAFRSAYAALYGSLPDRPIEIVSLRLRRLGRACEPNLPPLDRDGPSLDRQVWLAQGPDGPAPARAISRNVLLAATEMPGPLLIVDAEATTYVPPGWVARAREDGTVIMSH